MTKSFISRTNGLELHIPADMGSAVRFFSVGEDARAVIDDGKLQTRTNDPDQLKSELERAQARVAELEAQAAKNAAPAKSAKPAKAAKEAAAEPETDLA
jgi:hypothetical protein